MLARLKSMSASLRLLQQQFMSYLTSGNTAITKHVTQQGNISIDTRLHIYANAYRMRFKETIETDHPVLGIYLGDELYNLMLEGYINTHPSNHRSLRNFCDALPSYLRITEPFCKHLIISDIARFERTLLNSFDAQDSQRVTIIDLHAHPATQWPHMKFSFHPSMQHFTTHWNSVETWQAIKQDEPPQSALQQYNSHWLVWRNDERLTEFFSLPKYELAMINSALSGANFAQLCELLLEYFNAEDVSLQAVTVLKKWIELGLLIRIK
jgi:hypothetical protein